MQVISYLEANSNRSNSQRATDLTFSLWPSFQLLSRFYIQQVHSTQTEQVTQHHLDMKAKRSCDSPWVSRGKKNKKSLGNASGVGMLPCWYLKLSFNACPRVHNQREMTDILFVSAKNSLRRHCCWPFFSSFFHWEIRDGWITDSAHGRCWQ